MKINATELEFSTVVLSAVRYAIGRQTYVPSVVINFIKNNIKLLDAKDIVVILKDIKSAEENEYEYSLGDPTIDKPLWLSLKEFLQNELIERGN